MKTAGFAMSMPARALLIVLAIVLLGGCATSRGNAELKDHFEPMNRAFHAVNDGLDDAVLRPLADGYSAVTTSWMREAVTNFFANVKYPSVILNAFLQGKFEQGVEDTMRFIFNSTFGLAGLIDFSTAAGLPAHKEDFGQTLGVWGAGEIAYLELPLFGPSSVRDVGDLPLSRMVSMLAFVNSNTIMIPLTVLDVVNARANLSSAIAIRDRSALDPYVFTREAYRQRRRFLIYDGEPPDEEFDKLDQSSSLLFDGLPTLGSVYSQHGRRRS